MQEMCLRRDVFFPELTEQYGKIPEKRKLCAKNGKIKKRGTSIKNTVFENICMFQQSLCFRGFEKPVGILFAF